MNSGTLGHRQEMVYNALKEMGEGTDREIQEYLGLKTPNEVRPRRFDLVEKGIVHQVGKRKCKASGNTSIVWAVNRFYRGNLIW